MRKEKYQEKYSINSNRVRGLLYGQAIADSFGVGTEFMTKNQVKQNYPNIPYKYSDIVMDTHRNMWIPGDWTDDTDQTIVLIESVIECLENGLEDTDLIALHFSKKLLNWAKNGLIPDIDTCGVGIGKPVAWVLREECFETDPFEASKTVWEISDESLCEDGAIMRTAILSIIPMEWKWVKDLVIKCCKITHYDDRCIATCVFVNYIIYIILRNDDICLGKNFDELIEKGKKEAISVMNKYQDKFLKYFDFDNLEDLNLDEPTHRSDTKQPFRCFLWSLRNYTKGYYHCIWEIIRQGGDSDTNACVSGALLGAIYPSITFTNDLLYKEFLDKFLIKIQKFIENKT